MHVAERPSYDFGSFRLDADQGLLMRDGRFVPLRAKLFEALLILVGRHGRLVTKEELIEALWPDTAVEEGNLPHTVSMLRRALGESVTGQKFIETVPKRGYRFVADVTERLAPLMAAELDGPARAVVPELRQDIQFCSTGDGVRIAYATVGAGLTLIKAGNWLNHLEFDWRSPVWRHVVGALARDFRLIRYDARGNGLSDWNAADVSFSTMVRDLEAVVEAAGVKRFALLGISQGCAVSIAYAVRHPERVSHLVLHGGYARGWRRRGSPEAIRVGEAIGTLIEQGWGREGAPIHQFFTALFVPDGTPEHIAWFNELQRVSTSAKNAIRLREAAGAIDVADLLDQVRVPTLVLHSTHEKVVPFEHGRELATRIAGARFVPLESRNHLILEHEPAWPVFQDELRRFLTARR